MPRLTILAGPVSRQGTGHRWNNANNSLILTFEVCCTSNRIHQAFHEKDNCNAVCAGHSEHGGPALYP